ncbi:MAG: hypothetical protein AAF517_13390 [Planctomycetota bacterium]
MFQRMRTLAFGFAILAVGTPTFAKPDEKAGPKPSFHRFRVKTILDKDFDLRKLEGRVILVVNVASQ